MVEHIEHTDDEYEVYEDGVTGFDFFGRICTAALVFLGVLMIVGAISYVGNSKSCYVKTDIGNGVTQVVDVDCPSVVNR